MENKEKVIGGIDLSTWKQVFVQTAANGVFSEAFSDILFCDLYPNIYEEAIAMGIDEEDEEAIDEVYNSKWKFVNEAYKEIFGISLYEEEE